MNTKEWALERIEAQRKAIAQLVELSNIYEKRYNDTGDIESLKYANWCFEQIAKHSNLANSWYDFIERYCK